MAGTRSSDIPKLIVDGIDVIFNRELSKPIPMEYPSICTELSNEKEVGIYQQLGNIGPAYVIPEGDDFTFSKLEESYQTTIQVQSVGNAVAHSWVAMKNDLYNVIPQLFGKVMVDTLVEQREQTIADLYNHGFATTGADGVYVFSDSHPLTNSALLNDNLLDNEAMGVESLKKAYNRFLYIKGQSGRKFPTKATHLLFHAEKTFTVMELLESNLLAMELSNTVNSLKGLPVKPVASRYLDIDSNGDAPWFMLDRTLADAGAILQRQTGVEVDTWVNHESKEFRASVIERYGAKMVAPGYGCVGSVGLYTA